MVIKANDVNLNLSESRKNKITFVYPENKKELEQYGVKSLFVKVSSPTCPPCRSLQTFLEKYEGPKKIIVACLDVSKPNELSNLIISQYNIRGVPFFAQITPSLQTIYTVQGFNQEEIQGLLDKYDPNKKAEVRF